MPHRECLWEEWGGGVCLHGGEVSQAEADEAEEQFAALLNLS